MKIEEIQFYPAVVFKKYTKLEARYMYKDTPMVYICKDIKHKRWTPKLKQEAYYAMLRALNQYNETLNSHT